jgi:dihydrodipicolinate synthase/N-acetylneuraminate lyase
LTQLCGVLPVLQTPFRDDGEIDHRCLEREMQWVFGHRVDGVTTGMVSEVLRLSTSERDGLAERVCAAARAYGGTAVLSCGAESTRESLRHARVAAAAGATAVMAIPPLSATLGDRATFGYYAALLEDSGLPVVVQDASGYVGRPMSVGVQAQLFEAYGDRVYFKPEAPPLGQRLSALRDATNGGARVLDGSGGVGLVDAYRRGVVGTMPAADLCWALRRLWDALEAADEETIYRINGPLSAMIAIQTSLDSYIAVEKHLLHRQGVLPNAERRAPYDFELDPETEAEVDRLFDLIVRATGMEDAVRSATE